MLKDYEIVEKFRHGAPISGLVDNIYYQEKADNALRQKKGKGIGQQDRDKTRRGKCNISRHYENQKDCIAKMKIGCNRK